MGDGPLVVDMSDWAQRTLVPAERLVRGAGIRAGRLDLAEVLFEGVGRDLIEIDIEHVARALWTVQSLFAAYDSLRDVNDDLAGIYDPLRASLDSARASAPPFEQAATVFELRRTFRTARPDVLGQAVDDAPALLTLEMVLPRRPLADWLAEPAFGMGRLWSDAADLAVRVLTHVVERVELFGQIHVLWFVIEVGRPRWPEAEPGSPSRMSTTRPILRTGPPRPVPTGASTGVALAA